MRSENLPDGSNDKVTWKRSGDLLTKRRNNVTLRRDGDVPQRCYWVFYLGITDEVVETYQWDVKDTYHWDVLVTYQWDVVGCFIWDLFDTSSGRTDGTSLLRPLKTSSRRFNKMSCRLTTETSSRRSTETSLGVSFETYLRHHWDVQRDVVKASLRRLVARWDFTSLPTCFFEIY